jgi:predicted O-methyltransferase YrrM
MPRADLAGPIATLKRVLPTRLRSQLRRLRAKARTLWTYRVIQRDPLLAVRYFLLDRELDNFTYELTNEDELADLISKILSVPASLAMSHIDEIKADTAFDHAIQGALADRRDRNATMPLGRRLGWYAIARITRPQVVVETGVHDGLGSAVMLRALQRNASEGTSGSLVSFDVREDVGWIIPPELRSRHELHIGDALALMTLALGDRPVDLFIHDSDHRYEHESAEFEVVRPLARPGAVLITDNAHGGTAFRDFCDRHGLPCHVFREKPKEHFYPGAAMGVTRTPK